MMRINLLPHREIRRKQQQRQFAIATAIVAAAGLVLSFFVYHYLSAQFDDQVSRNKYLTDEIAKVEKEIAEINRLKEQTASLLNRKQVVETLQTNRADTVHLLEQLVRQLPDGMYLRSVRQQGTRVAISEIGRAHV